MATIHNADGVHNQSAHQVIHGDVNFYPSESVSSKRRRFGKYVDNPEQELDDAILASLAFPQMFDRRRNIDPPHYETCRWVFELEQYQSWLEKPSGLLWIKGKPGAGKSTIMSHMYSALYKEHFKHGGAYLEFFFTARGEPLQHTPVGMLRSILNQIFYQDPDVRDCLRKPYLDKCNSFGRDERLWDWQHKELELLLMDAILASAQKQRLTIFIDALDEAGDQSAREVARYFHVVNDRINKTSGTARICISCRHYPIPSNVKSVEINVEEHNFDDIDAFVRDNIRIEDLVINEPNELEKWHNLIDTLVRQAQGVFQWVTLVVPLVEKSISDGEAPEQVLGWLRKVPHDLEGVYKHILRNVIDERYRLKSLRLFKWVCLSERPHSLKQLRYALASHDVTLSPRIKCIDTKDFIKSDDTMALRVKSWSGGLLEVVYSVNGRSTVQVIHQSVDDFFRGRGFSFLSMLVNHEQEACSTTNFSESELIATYFGHLYWCCLSYIATDLDTVPVAEERALSWDEKENAFSKIEHEHPFIDTATMELLTLAKEAGNLRSRDFEKELVLLYAAIPVWLRLSLTNNLWNEAGIYYCSTPLHVAAAADMKDLTQFLIQRDVDVDLSNKQGWTPLHLAVHCGHLSLAKLLVSAKASLQSKTREGLTPLLMAADQGHIEVFTWLIGLGVSVTDIDSNPRNVLSIAAKNGHVSIVSLCLKAGVDVNCEEGLYETALQAASSQGHESTVSALIRAGANVNAWRGHHGTALQAASTAGSVGIINDLIKAGANVNAQGGDFGTALQAASFWGHESIVSTLIQAGADVKALGGMYGTALQAASAEGFVEVVRKLIKAGADVNARGGHFGSAIPAAQFRQRHI